MMRAASGAGTTGYPKLMNTHACQYILNTGKKRPCPSGQDCTVRESIRKRRAFKWVGKVKP